MLRRIIASSCIAVIAHLSIPTAHATTPDDDWARCNATPECVLWFDMLALNAWFTALDWQRDPCNDDWPIPAYIVRRESGCRWDADNPSSSAGGAFQMIQSTANNAALAIGHPELVGVNAAEWLPSLQEKAADVLWAGGAGSSHWAQTR